MSFKNENKNEFEYKVNFLFFLTKKPSISTNSPKLNYLYELSTQNKFELNHSTKIKNFLLYINFFKFLTALLFVQNINLALVKQKYNYFEKKTSFYSYNLFFNTNALVYKYSFTNLLVSSLSFYINLVKYYYIYNYNTKNVNLSENVLYSLPLFSHEITEIKPDKSKKIFFKKKQVKTFTYINDLKKKLTYIDASEIDPNLLKKHLYYKNIFINSETKFSVGKVTVLGHTYFSNKSLLFWKTDESKPLFKKIVVSDYEVSRYFIKYAYNLHQNIASNFNLEASTLDFIRSPNFLNLSETKFNRDVNFKKMFLYNFINLYGKTSSINYNSSYGYINYISEFRDYFFKKSHPSSRDIAVAHFLNQNKFNNFYPLYCLSFKKFKKLILFSKKQQSPIYSSYYMYYLVNFLELICKKKIWIRINTKKQISEEIYSKFIVLFNKNKSDQISIGKYFFLIEFYEIIYLSFINRDLHFFASWFKKIMEKIHLKKHRKAVKVVHSTIRNNLLFLELTGIKGFSMDVRGKLGTAGNSKKKHYAFTVGSIAPTTKAHGLNLCQTTIRTSTGVLGVTILMSY